MSTAELTDTQRAILELEAGRWKYAGAKDAAIRDQFDISPTRYYQLLDAVLAHPEARREDPLLVGRLLRLRESRRQVRTG